MKDWFKSVGTQVVANLVATGLLAVFAVAAAAAVVIWNSGGDAVELKVWMIVVAIGLVLVAYIWIAVCFAWLLGLRRSRRAPAAPAPHPHAQLLRRIDALRSGLDMNNPMLSASRTQAEAANQILGEARQATPQSAALTNMHLVPIDPEFPDTAAWDTRSVDAQLGQIHGILE
jgi:hypothetical protein